MWLAALGGMVIKLDHSFKAPKRIRDSTGQKQFAAVLTIMNEFCQVNSVILLTSGSLVLCLLLCVSIEMSSGLRDCLCVSCRCWAALQQKANP